MARRLVSAVVACAAVALVHLTAGAAGAQSISIVQFRRAVLTNKTQVTGRIPMDDTVPQFDEGTELLTVTITPTNASSVLVVEAMVYASELANTENHVVAALFRDIAPSAFAAGANLAEFGLAMVPVIVKGEVPAGSTNPTTFRLRVGGDGGATVLINAAGNSQSMSNVGLGPVLRSYLQVMEVRLQ